MDIPALLTLPARNLNNESLSGILEMLSSGVLAIGCDGRLWFANHAAKKILGELDAERGGPADWTPVYGWYQPDKTTLFGPDELPIRRALRGVETRDQLIFVRNAAYSEGVWVSVSAKPLRDHADNICAAAMTFRDVTAPRRFEQTNLLFSQAVEQIADALLITDKHGYIEYVNAAFEQMTGFSAEDVRGKTPRILRSGQQSAPFYQQLWERLLAGRSFQGVVINRKKTGDLFRTQQTITPITDETGSVSHFVSVMQDVTEALEKQEQEVQLRLARQIQQRFYGAVPNIPGFEIGAGAFPAYQTSGDYLDFIPGPHGCCIAALGDVEGHGFGSALVMALTRAYVRSFAILGLEVHDILQQVNRMLAADLGDGCFVTLLLAALDVKSQYLIYAGAGHVPGYLLSDDGQIECKLESSGPPLGLFSDLVFSRSPRVPLKPGHLLALVTDGIAESTAPDGVEFGVARLLDYLRLHRGDSAHDLVNGLYRESRCFAANEPQTDDIAAAIIKITNHTR